MAAFTSKATGNWSSGGQTTWNETGVPGSGDTVSIASGHTITVDVNTTSGGITMEGPLTVAAGVTLTLAGNCTQGNATFTLGSGSALCFDTTAANRKWLVGTANSQTNCKIVCNGTANGGDTTGKPPATMGTNHARIYKTGSNFAWFDESSEGSGTYVNNGGWDCTYTDFEDLGHNTADWCIRLADFGAHHRRFYYCTFDNCKQQFAVVYGWDGNGNMDWRVEYCRWINQPSGLSSGNSGMRYVFATAGSGTRTFKFNAVGEPGDSIFCMTLGAQASVEDCYFDSSPAMTGQVGCLPTRCVVRQSRNSQGYNPSLGTGGTSASNYLIADHVDPADRYFGTSGVGNAHFHEVYGKGTIRETVLEYPHESLIDQPDGFYGREDGSFQDSLIEYCLIIPSMTDGMVSSNGHPMIHGKNKTLVRHCTSVGKTSQLLYNERNMVSSVSPGASGREGTAQAGAASTITLDAGASATDDFYTRNRVFLTGGTGSGQWSEITDYVGATKVATVSPSWGTPPDATSTFAVTEVAVDECKSNLIAGESQSGSEWGALAYDTSAVTVNQIDTFTPANTTHNYVFQPVPADASIPGSVDGVRMRLSTTIPTSNIFDYSAGPQFVDATRNMARWARYKGVVGAEPERPALPVSYSAPAWQTWLTWKRDALDAARTLLMADPTLGYTDLMAWVKAGFRPNNPALNFAAHDGTTIGSEQYVSPAGGSTGALGGEGAVQKVSRPSSFSPGAYC